MSSIRFDGAALRKAFTEGRLARADLELLAKNGASGDAATKAAFDRISKAGDVRVSFAQVERWEGGPAIADLQKFAAQLLTEQTRTKDQAHTFSQRQAANMDSMFGGAVIEAPGAGKLGTFTVKEAANDSGPAPAKAAPAASAPASPTGKLEAAMVLAAEDGIIQFSDFAKLMRALGEDLSAAKDPQSVLAKADSLLDGLYAKTTTLPNEAQLLRETAAQFAQVLQEGGPKAFVEYADRLSQLKTPMAQAQRTPETMAAVTQALSDGRIDANEFGPVLRAIVKDLEAKPDLETLKETGAALELLVSRVTVTQAFTLIYEQLRTVMNTNPNDVDLTRLAGEFDKL